MLRRGPSRQQLDNELQRGMIIVGRIASLIGKAYHDQHPYLRSILRWPFHPIHPGPCHWLCTGRIGPWDHRLRCHMHPVLYAVAKRDLQRSLELHLLMHHGAIILEYHTLNRRPVRGSSTEIRCDQEENSLADAVVEEERAVSLEIRILRPDRHVFGSHHGYFLQVRRTERSARVFFYAHLLN